LDQFSLEQLENAVFSIQSNADFNSVALAVFNYQAQNVPVYKQFLKLLNIDPLTITQVEDIPFLPISLFKTQRIISADAKEEITFLSSGTTGMSQSQHLIQKLALYEASFLKAFEQFYGAVDQYHILALLPSYLEREGSSLIYMVDALIKKSNSAHSNYYLHNLDELAEKLEMLDKAGEKVVLIGVSYALLDLMEKHVFQLSNTIIMETGGMKGKRKEMIKAELHALLKKGFGTKKIHSEYGMTELLSQAYSLGNELFHCPNWMKILIREPNDPFALLQEGQSGGINVIDLANLYSCSFIATQDLGKLHSNNTFEVLGRFDNSDIRGCNLLVQ
tara:strand:+ start:8198 stop:9196 length:999 start_codon:yes stop_codon:yes gene_type:complete